MLFIHASLFALVVSAFAANTVPELQGRQDVDLGDLVTSVAGQATSAIVSIVNNDLPGATSLVGSVANDVTSVVGSVGGEVFSTLTSFGGQAFTVVSSAGGAAITLADSGLGVVTSTLGSVYTIAAAGSTTSDGNDSAATALVPRFPRQLAFGLLATLTSAFLGVVLVL